MHDGRRGPSNGVSRTVGTMGSLGPSGTNRSIDDDPMSKVLGLDEKTSGLGAWLGFTSGSTLLLVGVMALASAIAYARATQAHAAAATEEIDIMRDEPPPPPPPPAPEPEAKPEPAPPPRPHEAAPPPPPTPAAAAKVLTQAPDPNEPVDLTGNTIVQGNADDYAGGFTSGTGTNRNAVRTMPAASGVPGGTGPVTRAPVATGPDLSHPAKLGGSGEWGDCPFPEEANVEQLDEAYVTLQVQVQSDGKPAAVTVVKDPGNGFGREAKRCALGKPYTAATDRGGSPIPSVFTFRVHFTR